MTTAWRARANQQIVAFGDNLMRLYDNDTGDIIVTAAREGPEAPWTISGGEELADTAAASRREAVRAMTDRAYQIHPGTGLSTLIPTGLEDTP